MTIKQRLDQDLKTALLGGEKDKATVLRGLKSAILNAEIATGEREAGLSDDKVIELFKKEVKARVESAQLYEQGGNPTKAQQELAEKTIIETYLPAQLTDEQLEALVDAAIADSGATSPQAMGQVIGAVKQQAGGAADGARIAALVKERLT